MEHLLRLNITVEPLTRDDIQEVTQLIVSSYETDNPLISKNLQAIDVLESKTLQMLPLLFEAQRKINQQRNTSIFYMAKYMLDGKMVGTQLNVDLVKFIQILNSTQAESYYDPIKKLGDQNLKMGTDYYAGKMAVSRDMMKQGLARFIIMERMNYLYLHGYRMMHSVLIHPSILKFSQQMGTKIIDKVQMKNNKNQPTIFYIGSTNMEQCLAKYFAKSRPKL